MKSIYAPLLLAAGLFGATATYAATAPAAAPADAPAGTTALCKDGTYFQGETKKGACKGHKGIKDWYGGATAPTATPTAPAGQAGASTAQPAPATAMKAKTPTPAKTAAPGGGPGLVWVNTSTKVYHCNGDKWYGTTKAGEYMSEADAKSKGFHASAGKACS
jgi:hypothetical protein